jgi:hypothetical protein
MSVNRSFVIRSRKEIAMSKLPMTLVIMMLCFCFGGAFAQEKCSDVLTPDTNTHQTLSTFDIILASRLNENTVKLYTQNFSGDAVIYGIPGAIFRLREKSPRFNSK